jgi:hypothetical protein
MEKNQNGFTTFEGKLPYHTSAKSVEWFKGYMEKPVYGVM